MKNRFYPAALLSLLLFYNCNESPKTTDAATGAKDSAAATTTAAAPAKKTEDAKPTDVVANAATLLSRKDIPVLCYHHIRDFKPNEKASMKAYIVPINNFKEQMKSLADSGYQTITPTQYNNYMHTGTGLPEKPVMLTYDDTDEEQHSIAKPEMDKYGFKGVYFIMTISIGRPNYMSKEQLKDLADNGHIIGAHTWDHHNVKKYTDKDWDIQFKGPKEKLEAITGKPVEYFAYPFGLWNHAAIPQLQQRGYKAAYQLADRKMDSLYPLYSLRRMLVPGTWSVATMHRAMRQTFGQQKGQ